MKYNLAEIRDELRELVSEMDDAVKFENMIEQVFEEVDRYKKALREIAYDSLNDSKEDLQEIAEDALKGGV